MTAEAPEWLTEDTEAAPPMSRSSDPWKAVLRQREIEDRAKRTQKSLEDWA